MIVEGGGVAPDLVAAQFDQPCAKHDPADEPAEQNNNKKGWFASREGARVEERGEKDGEEPGLEQLDLPAIAIPLLADVTKRHIEKPEDGKNGSVGEAG